MSTHSVVKAIQVIYGIHFLYTDLCLLDPVVRTELCSLLNSTATSNNWYKLATELHLEDMAKLFRDDSNPTDCIIDSYIVSRDEDLGFTQSHCFKQFI